MKKVGNKQRIRRLLTSSWVPRQPGRHAHARHVAGHHWPLPLPLCAGGAREPHWATWQLSAGRWLLSSASAGARGRQRWTRWDPRRPAGTCGRAGGRFGRGTWRFPVRRHDAGDGAHAGAGPAVTGGACGLARRRSVPRFGWSAPFSLRFSLQTTRFSAQKAGSGLVRPPTGWFFPGFNLHRLSQRPMHATVLWGSVWAPERGGGPPLSQVSFPCK
jgi:hypothetical protein